MMANEACATIEAFLGETFGCRAAALKFVIDVAHSAEVRVARP